MEYCKRSFSLFRYLIAGFVFLSVFGQGQSEVCTETGGLFKKAFSCPRYGDNSDRRYCCTKDNEMQCCFNPFGLDDDHAAEQIQQIAENVGTVVAAVVGVIGFIIVVCLVCCCVCPFCLLYKRRQSGAVYHSTQAAQSATVTVVPAGGSYPLQPNYPPQPGYPAAQYSYPPAQPSYPPAQPSYGYGPQGNAPPPGFAQQQSYPAYQPLNQDQPIANDAYQKAPPYNPNY